MQTNEPDLFADHRRVLRVLTRALSPLEAIGDPTAMARRVADLLVSTVALGCQVDLLGEGTIETIVARPLAQDARVGRLDAAVVTAVARSRAPRVIDADDWDLTWVVLPLSARGLTVGTIAVAIDPTRWRLAQEDLAELRRVSDALAVALADAEVHERASHVSHTLQESLLPAVLPTGDWFELAGRHVPGTTGLDIGGDWYDAQILADGTLAFSVGDVAGHGVEAAARMGELRSATTALRLVRRAPDDLMSVLHRLTASMGYFATAVCARLGPAGNLVWASAGHLPPLRITPHGEVIVLEREQSPPLGVDYRDAVPLQRCTVEAGEVVVLFTDGLVERRDESLDISVERLAKRIGTIQWEGPGDLVDAVLAGRDDDARSTRDDIAVMAVHRRV